MKSKLLPITLAGLAFVAARADDLTFQTEVVTSIQQYGGGVASAQSYGTNLNFFAFNPDWGLTHDTPYVPQSVGVGPLLGATYTLSDLTTNPSYYDGSLFRSASGSAFGFEAQGAAMPFTLFGGNLQLFSYDKADILPYAATFTGGNFDQVSYAFDLDAARLPEIPAFSVAMTDALAAASATQALSLTLPGFNAPYLGQNAYRYLVLTDITTATSPIGGTGIPLDPGMNTFTIPAGTFTAGDQYGLSLYDSYTDDKGTLYSAGTFFVFQPRAVPETGASGPCVLLALGGVALVRRRIASTARPA